MVSIKHISNNEYLSNSQISNSYVVYSDLNRISLYDKAKLHSFKLCLTQKEIYRIDGKEVVLNSGEFLMVNPNQKFEVIADKQNTKGLCLFFDSKEMGGLESLIFSNNKYDIADSKLISRSVSAIHDEIIDNKRSSYNVDLVKFFDIIIDSENVEYFSTDNLPLTIRKNRAEIAHCVLKAKNFMDSNIYEKLSIDHISDSVYISKFYFIRLFKDLFGTTPYKYLLEKKLEESKKLLISHNIDETAKMLNFTDRSAYSNKFQRQYGLRPSKFKSMIRH